MVVSAAERKKYLKFKTSSLLNRYAISNVKKNLKNVIDFTNLTKSEYSFSCRYNDLKKFRHVEKRIIKKNKKIIFISKSNLVVNIFDLR